MDDDSFELRRHWALSIRQPWAWAIVHAGKDIENRCWKVINRDRNFRGAFWVHASKGMTREEYEDAAGFMASLGVTCPPPADLMRGGVIGTARVIGFVPAHDSKWFMGPEGLVLADAEPCKFVPCGGKLGFFKWQRSADAAAVPPAKRMTERAP